MSAKKKTEEAQEAESSEHEEHNHDDGHDHAHGHPEPSEEEKAKIKAKEEAEKKRKEKYTGKKVENGAILKMDIYAKTVEERPITFIACNDTDAKELLDYDPKKFYHPQYYTVGENVDLPLKVKEKIDASNYYDEFELELEPADAYGVRKGDLVKQLNSKKIEKELGKEIRLGMTYTDRDTQMTGTIIRNNQGRALVDFNHPLVDRKCKFKVKILDVFAEADEKIEGTLAKNGMDEFEYTFDEETKNMEIIIPDNLKFNQQWMQDGWRIKFMLSMELQRNAGINDLKFSEIYKNFSKDLPKPAEDKEEEAAEEGKEEDSAAKKTTKKTTKKSTKKTEKKEEEKVEEEKKE